MLQLVHRDVNPQVSSNGLISFSSPYPAYSPQTFPISQQVVAPYWDIIDTRMKGYVSYAVITEENATLSCLLELTSRFISSREGGDFEASWMLVARWVNVCPFQDGNCVEVNDMKSDFSN